MHMEHRPEDAFLAAGAPASSTYPVQGAPSEGRAIPSLVLGIFSVILTFACIGFLFGIPAVILGHMSRSNIRKSLGRLTGAGMALTGLIMGYISIVIPLALLGGVLILRPGTVKFKAGESASLVTVRAINAAEAAYSINSPSKGFAPDLATLGRITKQGCQGRGDDYACLLSIKLMRADCSGANWCKLEGYQYNVSSRELGNSVSDYVVSAVPVTASSGSYNYCSTSNGVVHFNKMGSRISPYTREECIALPFF
ncbi:MAG TPA: DUF4190 domain-containing protein [Candidatus Angelobacter sp.]|nr:DUF4190 domain-containing protein [Candidatus Angelobacter sp.]